ncbi:MAG: hypothetical protein H7A03_09905 [Pseudomonadales bacterium]|nr:hypothetical protein [Pseudomonadales bacterium]
MPRNSNAPHFVLAAVMRIYPELPNLISQESWLIEKEQIDNYIAQLEAKPNDYLASTQLVGLLARYEPARQRFAQEMTVQAVVFANIEEQMYKLGENLGMEAASLDGLSAAAFTCLQWEVDSTSLPLPHDSDQTRITISKGGVDGATSVKFKNLRINWWNLTVIAAGFITTGFDVINTPHPLFITGSLILVAGALHDEFKEHLGEQEASVFWGLIKATELNQINNSENEIIIVTNEERAKYGLPELSMQQIRYSLRKLEKLKSVEMVNGSYRIVEKYTVKD